MQEIYDSISKLIGKPVSFQVVVENQILTETQILKEVRIAESINRVLCYFENSNYVINATIIKSIKE